MHSNMDIILFILVKIEVIETRINLFFRPFVNRWRTRIQDSYYKDNRTQLNQAIKLIEHSFTWTDTYFKLPTLS